MILHNPTYADLTFSPLVLRYQITMVPWSYGTIVLWYYCSTVLWYYIQYYGTAVTVLLYYGSMVYGSTVLWYYCNCTTILWLYGIWYCSDTILFYVVQDYGTEVLWFNSSMLVHGTYYSIFSTSVELYLRNVRPSVRPNQTQS